MSTTTNPTESTPNLPPPPSDIDTTAANHGSSLHDTMSPTDRVQRRDSLEKHLQMRPDPQDLKDRHILLDTTAAPALQQKQQELERQRATDNLKKGLATRPERDNLVERNILHAGNQNIAPSLQSPQRELQKHMTQDSLEQALKDRPKKEELVKEGILKDEEAIQE
ncbi:MAG: hypothetical protein M1828_000230 [Chrysothrix sp. TS-e1954]|nr:MAG: hypothetical protein M1828_000230 [Chrysothrix sp. TS-e1954]